MATRASKTTKKVSTTGVGIAPDLPVRDLDLKYTGFEPVFNEQPLEADRKLAMTKAFIWYSRYCDKKTAKEQIALYADQNAPALAKLIRRVDDNQVTPSYGWLARLSLRGLTLTGEEIAKLGIEIQRMIGTTAKPEIKKEEKQAQTRPNVQEIMREKARQAGGTLEGVFDEFILAGAKSTHQMPNVVGILTENSVLPAHISLLLDPWKQRLSEFHEVADGKDRQLAEGYSQLNKHQLKASIKFIEAVISGLQGYINVKKASKAPRKRKVVSPEKQASKIKYLKTYDELKLVSVPPAKIIGATEVWAYDTAKRKLHYYIADQHVGSLGVKGSTILGFDAAKSGIKTVRKPEEVIKKFMAAGKPAARKLFGDIKAVQAQPNGRTNSSLVFLKAF